MSPTPGGNSALLAAYSVPEGLYSGPGPASWQSIKTRSTTQTLIMMTSSRTWLLAAVAAVSVVSASGLEEEEGDARLG